MYYNESLFMSSNPNIVENPELREPQVDAYISTMKHFMHDKKTTHALIVLPTGVGKTGLMGLLPYFISNGRVLIITPQLSIKDSVVSSLDPDNPENFWVARKVFKTTSELPNVIEYSNEITYEVMSLANVVILNIHKLQKRLQKSPLHFLPKDFFDMVIIDEAHHSTAKSWVDTIQHFDTAKIIKLTGTPFRTDGQELTGELVYKYSLGKAMANKYVKSLENINYVPDELRLTIDEDETKTYTVDELYRLGIKDEEWVARSVAFSRECTERVVDKSIGLLEKKLVASPNVPHKIIGVACSIYHANQIKEIYESKGMSTTILHSDLDELDKQRAYNDIKNNRVKVVINVAMLGEGYDHKYLSIAAIFRPFKAELPYIQFIGRILRIIPENEVQSVGDNIGQIISHKDLGMETLWNKYKKEIEESEIIAYLKNQDELEEFEDGISRGNNSTTEREVDPIGKASEVGEGSLVHNAYVNTELIERYKRETEEFNRKVDEIQSILKCSREQAEQMVRITDSDSASIKRPDLYFKKTRKDLDTKIRYEMVPQLISKHSIDKAGTNLRNLAIFDRKYKYVANTSKSNAEMLARYFNAYLKNELGSNRDIWSLQDYEIANTKLDKMYEYIDAILDDFIN